MTKSTVVRLGLGVALLALSFFADSRPASTQDWRWYKGNLHTHTTHSDGDSSPEFVARWYKEHGYQFLVLSDHNYFTEPVGLNTVLGAKERFLLIGGEEVTSRYEKKAIHVNAFGINGLVPPVFGPSVVDTIQGNVDAIREVGGLASLNHPNFRWSVTAEEMRRVRGLKLFEVYNGHPQVHNVGGGGRPGLDEMWDAVLSAGREVFGVAVDDAHHFKRFGPEFSNPGRGWVAVRTTELSERAVLDAIDTGEFYSSTGVELAEVARLHDGLRIRIEQAGDFRYTTRYIGVFGKVLAESEDLVSDYTLQPGDKYVRAVVTDSMGWQAWIQPVFGATGR